MLKKIAQVKKRESLSNRLRRKRFELFLDMIKGDSCPVDILDIGGTKNFWKQMDFDYKNKGRITLLNIHPEESQGDIISLQGEAVDLSRFDENEFDMVFSNSTIEHLFDFENQKKMAKEAVRVGKKYFIQTPNHYFPMEPHFLFPFFQFFPVWLKVWLLMRFNLGWRKKEKNKELAEKSVREIRLLNKKEMQQLFPGAEIWEEKFMGITKSFVAYGESKLKK